ncbi:MAG TPA: porin family protein [Candidatus Binatia bacterium]|nr:porin family protein [Candidatus Binatia bacterium]
MKRTGTCLLSTLILLGSAATAMAGAYGEDVTTEAPAQAPAGPAPAATETVVETRFDRTGGYLEVGGIYVVQLFDNDAGIVGVPLDDAGNTGGYEIRAGYRWNKWVAIEGEWEQYLHFKNVPQSNAPDAGRGHNLDAYNIMANVKFFPIDGRFQPYVIGGIGMAKVELEAPSPVDKRDEAGFAARFGAGVDIYITDNIGVAFEVDYILPTGDAHEFDLLPIGGSIFYRFG